MPDYTIKDTDGNVHHVRADYYSLHASPGSNVSFTFWAHKQAVASFTGPVSILPGTRITDPFYKAALFAAVRRLVSAIPEEKQSEATLNASETLRAFIREFAPDARDTRSPEDDDVPEYDEPEDGNDQDDDDPENDDDYFHR